MIYVVIFFIAFVLSLFFLPITMKISKKYNIFSKSRDNTGAKPCLGGIGIFAAFLLAILAAWLFRVPLGSKALGLLLASGIIISLGIIDDAKDLMPLLKIAVEFFAIALLLSFGFITKIAVLPVWVNFFISLVWILFITNAFNLLDILDGLTSGLVVIISFTLFVISLINRDVFSSIILMALIGSHIGFLRYNYPPAKVYMGDTGSLFSGFLLAVIAINISYAPIERPIALVTPILAMSLPIYDTLFLIIVRMKKHRPIFKKTEDHLALRLITMGCSPSKSLWIMYMLSIFLAFASLVVMLSSNLKGIAVIAVVSAAFIFIGKKVGVVKVK
ncbi:MAG: undecaprenyl/decaprenyl-phosphate alpha-N-acetylglucosaminyl 1-phosphate transferase [Candidatus Omnitrophica bacterium]|nr:undecaprenyl/decaprenyl-phosphate alpha-N-acetylglucosaminyl 1-phosphate transferase [Candidatus Omnitrophota bacterium]